MKGSDYELEDWIANYLSGNASAEETSALEKRLSNDSAARSLFLVHARMEAALSSEAQPDLEIPAQESPVAFSAPRPPRFRLAAAAAIALTAVIVAFLASKKDGERIGVRANILAASGSAAETYHAGETMWLDEARLSGGAARFQLPSGVVIDLHAPAEVRFVDPMHTVLKEGDVTVDVADASVSGFVLESPTVRIVDHGTRFGVSYHEDGETDVAVLDGSVSLFKQSDAGDDEPFATLTEGDAVRIDSRYETRRLAAVSLDGLSLAILEGNGKNSSVVSDVTDSIREADFRRFYSIAPGAMGPGARPYSTLGKPRWQAMPGEDFPEELAGADVVATFSPDRFDANLSLTLTLEEPSTMYVLVDERAAVPTWLRRDFTKTVSRMRAGPWGKRWADRVVRSENDELGYIHYDVWKREVSDREVVLGSPSAGVPTHETAMYGLAVKANRDD